MFSRVVHSVRPVSKGLWRILRQPKSAARFCNHVGRHSDCVAFTGMVKSLARSEFTVDFWKWYAEHSAWTKTFYRRYDGEDCFLLGNGPSLNKVDLSALNRYHLVGLNKIY